MAPGAKYYLFLIGDDEGTIVQQEIGKPVEFVGENALARLEAVDAKTGLGPSKAITSLAIELKKLQDNWPAMTLTEEA